MLNIFQFFVVILLSVVLTFGIGFILNMLLKTTWLPIFIFLGLILYVVFFYQSGSLVEAEASYGLPEYSSAVAGLAGAYLSGVAISQLRKRGYRMF
jgi:ABC-type transport system involved in multi-copper enzyme maturation permease subunit